MRLAKFAFSRAESETTANIDQTGVRMYIWERMRTVRLALTSSSATT